MMKRCSSLSDIDHTYNGRKSNRNNLSSTKTKVYRGRLSLNKAAATSKNQRRKSRASYYFDYEDENDPSSYCSQNVDYPHSTSDFLCLPVVARENSTSSSEGYKSYDSSYSPSSEDEIRRHLFMDLQTFINSKQVPSSKIKKHAGEEGKEVITIGGNKYIDVLWLVLKAYFSGREVCAGQNGFHDEDKTVLTQRNERFKSMIKIMEFSALPHVCRQYRKLEPGYMQHLASVREDIYNLFQEYEHFQFFFPNSRAMQDYITSTIKDDNNYTSKQSKTFTSKFMERVDVLNAWINTVDDLDEKISMLGTLFEVDPSSGNWPKRIYFKHSQSNQSVAKCISLEDCRDVFKQYVGRSLALKGMKKVLKRVWSICEITIVKTALLLHEQPQSYAEAASRKKSHYLILSKELKERYDSDGVQTSKYGLSNAQAIAMNLPSFVPLFYFLLGTQMELVLEWLTVRSKYSLSLETKKDLLTLDAMIVDCKDCIEEAVEVKRRYLSIVESTGRIFCKQYSQTFDSSLLEVFKNYLNYFTQWCETTTEDKLFSIIEKEWKKSLQLARSIYSGVEHQSNYFLILLCYFLDNYVVDYWEKSVERVCEASESEDVDNSEDGVDLGNETFQLCREHNKVIREVKDRSVRICSLIKTVLSDLHNSSGYRLKVDLTDAIARLSEAHALIEIDPSLRIAILVDHATADCAGAEELLTSLCESRTSFESVGYLLIFPDHDKILRSRWHYRTVKVVTDEEMLVSLRHIRTDVICAVGKPKGETFTANESLSSILELVMPACSTNDIIDNHLRVLNSSLVKKLKSVWSIVTSLQNSLHEEVDNLYDSRRRNADSMNRAFALVFQLYRDALRMVAEAGHTEEQLTLVRRSIAIVKQWVLHVERSQPTRSSQIPVWASGGFTFMSFLCEEKFTSSLPLNEILEFREYVNRCKTCFIRDSDSQPYKPAPISTQRKPSYFQHTKQRAKEGTERRKRLKEAALDTDAIVSERQHYLNLGKVVTVKHEKFTLPKTRSDPVEIKRHFVKHIGSGMSSVVHQYFHIEKKKYIAVKIIKVDQQHIKMVESEIGILRNLRHPNLVEYYGYEIVNDDVHISMEYCAEGTLDNFRGEPLHSALVRRYTNSLLQAVAYLHLNKVVHRDIKPANIFINRSTLKLGDFGCSVSLLGANTVVGEIAEFAGTPAFMAPEMTNFGGKTDTGDYKGYGRAVDIWSVGCVVLQLLTGQSPWPSMNRFQILYRLGNKEKPEIPRNLTEMERNFLSLCFVYNPEERKCADALLQEPFANVHIDEDHV